MLFFLCVYVHEFVQRGHGHVEYIGLHACFRQLATAVMKKPLPKAVDPGSTEVPKTKQRLRVKKTGGSLKKQLRRSQLALADTSLELTMRRPRGPSR